MPSPAPKVGFLAHVTWMNKPLPWAITTGSNSGGRLVGGNHVGKGAEGLIAVTVRCALLHS